MSRKLVRYECFFVAVVVFHYTATGIFIVVEFVCLFVCFRVCLSRGCNFLAVIVVM